MNNTIKKGFLLLPLLFILSGFATLFLFTTQILQNQTQEAVNYSNYHRIQNFHITSWALTESHWNELPDTNTLFTPDQLLENYKNFYKIKTNSYTLYLVKSSQYVYSVAVSLDQKTRSALRRKYKLNPDKKIQWETLEQW
jgi:hypothetical protein